jgi:hypothetical protein
MTGNVILMVFFSAAFAFAQDHSLDIHDTISKGIFVVAFRTPAHVRSSSPEVFHTAAEDVRKILTDGNVQVIADKERGFIENESPMSIQSMTRLAREAGAVSLLFVTIDRPSTKWIKLVLQMYDLEGKMLWEESVDNGMSGLSGSSGYKKCFEKLKKKLPARIGGPGLPINAQ